MLDGMGINMKCGNLEIIVGVILERNNEVFGMLRTRVI